MYSNILIATDGSELAKLAVDQGLGLAKSVGAAVTVVTVTEPFHWFDPNMVPGAESAYAEGASQTAKKTLSAVSDAAAKSGVKCEIVHAESERAYKAIIDAAKAKKCDLIVMASHGRRGVSAMVLGSVTMKVLTHSNIPVLVVR